ncbi:MULTISPECIES: hypothetical protein [Thermomonospora]|uniref:Uncharacterized protein n=1 Tax=Thermomonospora cellulosilytica TaxID=1411118 RepID=A0A7W3R7G2_9ACTN|nr:MULTISPECIES: hypothetical protein [Thermomonospora]MBA9002295.1 hypothetical protein [Thermomonospora cellulosilytica]
MGSLVLKVAGIVLAVWLVLSVLGAILSTLKFFFMVGLVAAVVVLVVTLIAKAAPRG